MPFAAPVCYGCAISAAASLVRDAIPDQFKGCGTVPGFSLALAGYAENSLSGFVISHRGGERPQQFDPLFRISDSSHRVEPTVTPVEIKSGTGGLRVSLALSLASVRFHANLPSTSIHCRPADKL